MAVVRGVKEKVHSPLYDMVKFDGTDVQKAITDKGNQAKFFIDVQGKTKLETNQQEAGVLSHYNTYEARALRVIVEPPAEDDGKDFLQKFIYNSVTSFIVGEKIMIQAPTFFFPSGAGPSNLDGSTNGSPTPAATFRFAEPVNVSHQQNFRVEIEFPRGVADLGFDKIKKARVWVVLDGYLTRDVQ